MREDERTTGTSAFSEDDLRAMRRNVVRHFVKFLFSGRDEALVFQVDEETSSRIQRNISDTPSDFCCFTTLDGREVAANLGRLDYVHFLWDAALPELAAVEHWSTSIYFSDRQEAFCCDPQHEVEAYDVFFRLDGKVDDTDPFIALTDEDGEVVSFDVRHIDAIQMSASLVAEGWTRLKDELEKEAESSEH